MKSIVQGGVVLVLLTASALAQQADQPTPPRPQDTEQARVQVPQSSRGDKGTGVLTTATHRRAKWNGIGALRPPSKAARFRIEMGDVSIGVKCPDDQPMKDCADFTVQLLDRIAGMTRH